MSIKINTLFNISPHNMTLNEVKNTLSEYFIEQLSQFTQRCQQHIGILTGFHFYPYRITNTNHINVHLKGEEADLTLTLTIAGYTDISTEIGNSPRVYLYFVDATDCYWFIQLLKTELSTPCGDKAVNNQEKIN